MASKKNKTKLAEEKVDETKNVPINSTENIEVKKDSNDKKSEVVTEQPPLTPTQTELNLYEDHDEYVKKKNKKNLIIIISSVSVLLIAAVVYILFEYNFSKKVEALVNVDTFYNGIIINGTDMGGKTKDEAIQILSEIEKTLSYPVDITVTYQEHTTNPVEADFDYDFDTTAILEEAYAYARDGDNYARYKVIKDLEETPKEFNITKIPLMRTIPAIVEKIASEVNVAAVEPHVSEFKPFETEMFVYVDGTNGYEIDQADLKTKLEEALKSNEPQVVSPKINEVKFTQAVADLPAKTQLLAKYSTVSTNTANGNRNMELSLAATNGQVLQPGDVFSFNGSTGNTTNGSLGYLQAGAIINGKLSQAYGGGICQSSSTIYGAVLRSNLEIVARGPHSWPSSYVPIGQDAAVDYPGADLKFKNNKESAIYIKTYMVGKTLYAEIYGPPSAEWDNIEITSQTTETIPAGATTYKDDPTLPVGTEEFEREARTGYRAVASRIFYKDGVEIKREAAPSSYYRPISAIIKRGTIPVETPPQNPA